jgi:hypothetical protein
MFGLYGNPLVYIDWESHGNASPASERREFLIDLGLNSSLLGNAKIDFNIDNVIGTIPELQRRTGSAFIIYNNNNNVIYTTTDKRPVYVFRNPTFWTLGGLFQVVNLIGNSFYTVSASRGFAFSSTQLTITPPTRKSRAYVRYDLVHRISFTSSTNNTGYVADRNNISGVFDLDMRFFPNAHTLNLNESYMSTLNIWFNDRIEILNYTEHLNISSFNVFKKPTTIKHVVLAANGSVGITTLEWLNECIGLQNLYLVEHRIDAYFLNTGILNSLIGVLDISMHINLINFSISTTPLLTNIILPTIDTWDSVFIENCNITVRDNFDMNKIDDFFNSPNIQVIHLSNNGFTKTGFNINNQDIKNTLKILNLDRNSFSGSIEITENNPSLIYFKLGNLNTRVGIQQNSFPTVDISGLSGVRYLDLCASNIENLVLPENTVMNKFYIMDNKLDYITNPNLQSQIESLVNVDDMRFSFTSTNPILSNIIGQNSTNGLGSDLDMSALDKLTILLLGNCKLTGSLFLPPNVTTLEVSLNPNLENLVNIPKNINTLRIFDNTSLILEEIDNTYTNFVDFRSRSVNSLIRVDISGKNTIDLMVGYTIISCANFEEFIFPTISTNTRFGNNYVFSIENCASFHSVQNIEVINFTAFVPLAVSVIRVINCPNFNQAILFGIDNFIPRNISLNNNNLNTENLDIMIDSIYQNKNKWDVYTAFKIFNIGGVGNSAPTGTYQEPSGFILGESDGTPTSPKEQVYVLVNNYNWSITMN